MHTHCFLMNAISLTQDTKIAGHLLSMAAKLNAKYGLKILFSFEVHLPDDAYSLITRCYGELPLCCILRLALSNFIRNRFWLHF